MALFGVQDGFFSAQVSRHGVKYIEMYLNANANTLENVKCKCKCKYTKT